MTDRRIVITGIGVISPLGNDLASTWEAMKAGRSGIDTIKSMDVTGYSTKIAGEVKDFDPAPYFKTPKDARRVDRFTHFAMGAAGMALKDSGLDLEAEDKTRIGVMVGSGIGGLGTLESQHATLLSKGPARVSPFMIPYMISNIASGLISMEYGLGGPNMSIVTACATSNHNIGEAWRIMKFGDADVMVCGGAEATILPTGVAGFSNMRPSAPAMTSPSGPPARTTWTATASSWAKAPALSFWKRWNTPKSAAQKFTGNSSATASPRTPTTSPPRTRKAAAPPAA